MPYTKSGVYYTAKPTGVSTKASMKKAYGGGYMGGPKYAPGYYRGMTPTGVRKFPMRAVGRSAGAQTATEKKYYDSLKSASAVAASTDWTATEQDPATLNTLVVPVQGAQINNRIGRKIYINKLRIRGVLTATANADQADVASWPNVRMILYQDQQTNGAQAQGEEVMAAPATATAPLAFSSHQSLANFGRFKVWKDKTYSFKGAYAAPDTATGTFTNSNIPQTDIPFKWNIVFRKPIPVHFNSSNGGVGDGDVGDIVDNSFHIIAQKSSASGVVSLSYTCRAVYTDN